MKSKGTLADSQFYLLIGTIIIAIVVTVVSYFWRIDHANFWSQTVYLSLLGMSGLEIGVTIERHYQKELRELRSGDKAGMAPTGTIIGSLLSCCALLGLFQLWWALAWGSNQSSFWLLTQVGFAFAAIAAIIGSQSA